MIELLLRHCADLGVEVEWYDLGARRRGDYCDATRTIRLNSRLADWQQVSTLAHETGHAVCRDVATSAWIEDRASQIGAALILDPATYSQAEDRVGPHVGALAVELGVSVEIVAAWRRWCSRKGLADVA